MMTNTKEFDAVAMMREAREQLSLKYWQRPDVLKRDMEEIHKKYSFCAQEDTQPNERVVDACLSRCPALVH
jgi:hypothetical protein